MPFLRLYPQCLSIRRSFHSGCWSHLTLCNLWGLFFLLLPVVLFLLLSSYLTCMYRLILSHRFEGALYRSLRLSRCVALSFPIFCPQNFSFLLISDSQTQSCDIPGLFRFPLPAMWLRNTVGSPHLFLFSQRPFSWIDFYPGSEKPQLRKETYSGEVNSYR